jgi:hypothetical protein
VASPANRPDYREALRRVGALDLLEPFDPHVAGTPPLGLDVAGSDIDILCHAPDAKAFAQQVWTHFAELDEFSMHQWTNSGRPVIAGFVAEGWAFEIFGAVKPIAQQAGWRHFRIEERLLALYGDALRTRIMALRCAGMKTEPAFATAFGLSGDPYAALLELEQLPDAALSDLLGL